MVEQEKVETKELVTLVQHIGEAVLATTETVEKLSNHVDGLSKQVQQQGYQIFALSDAVQTLAENHDAAIARMDQVIEVLQRLVKALELPEDSNSSRS
ncbi:hypothetical protein H6G02_12120 [Leptolyngbya sp. FACHB-16]|nr:hypothetical protein [Leptolyngbya sp. FACHB-8]MBD2155257.1 hypothetical protein [Leptolyngbya sp. FACHB-16]